MLLTAEFAALLLSQFVMSWLADTRSRRFVILLSMGGSGLNPNHNTGLKHESISVMCLLVPGRYSVPRPRISPGTLYGVSVV